MEVDRGASARPCAALLYLDHRDQTTWDLISQLRGAVRVLELSRRSSTLRATRVMLEVSAGAHGLRTAAAVRREVLLPERVIPAHG